MRPGDWFIDMFTSEAEKLLESLKARQAGRSLQSVDTYWWVPGLPEDGDADRPVAAVDGGGGFQPLAMGWSLYIARAYGYVEGGEPERGLELRLYPVRDTRVLDSLRSWLEHRIAVRLVHRLPPGSILLMDGSLWTTITSAFRSIARLASSSISGIGGVYTALHSSYLLAEVATLCRTAAERGVRLAYVSKDHGFRALKEKVLLEMVASKAKPLAQLVSRALDYYPLAMREQLLSARRLVPRELRGLYDAALDPSYRDPAFLADTAGFSVGYTWPLRLPPPHQLHSRLRRGGLRGLLEAAAEKAYVLLGDEPEASEFRSLAERLPELLDQLPGVSMVYVRLAPGDQPLLVEIPGPSGSYYSTGRVLVEPDAAVEEVLAALRRGYGDPDYYNIPLIAAHLNATITGRQMEEYMGLLESLALAQGVGLRFTRRYSISRRFRRRFGRL
ncbi:DNA double-strand break repair nuclease NurA [Hyperthermus butylicus]|uniref:NurA domain-containing protein n=1 Tax=Hyperthermus butylicus (strain DSM 5456 / JCM 9403 / PLM1-5) TaxID=415426 RepID=A2BN04_HYPBU|nr:DNA double-strand break repair nuclease NurA [Hyperthermus butylicus]ABM81365.1 hypothetical protein Hbut_1543 [Hyperthermus butylicus DSM 5456]